MKGEGTMSVQSAARPLPNGSYEKAREACCPTVGPVPMFGGAVAAIGHAARLLLEWQQRVSERRHFLSLDDRMLRDIGLSRGDIDRL
jgi:uncharacterized protein YjiS (DUF1127 family)